ncbi:MAG TPA: HAMP domain-containing sensor histidine kinase [Polyangiaceae bacterium]|nr:HAMP domain-containing sensor histidine kinase [Polyangiaceae bacterium]
MRRGREHRRERWGPHSARYFHGPRLRRKIFVWFGVSIAVTAAVVMMLANRAGAVGWGPSLARARTFVGGQFAVVWTDAARRDTFAGDLARDLELQVRLADEKGETIGTFGKACKGSHVTAPVEREGTVLGSVDLCEPRRHHPGFFLPFAVAIAMLWGASGAIAHRLVRPLSELARVAQDIGKGQLASRVRLSPRQGMEFVMVGNVMNEMASRIEKQLADQRALLATVSHEIRTPLSRMRLLIEFAREKAEANLARLAELRAALGPDASDAPTSVAAANAERPSPKGPLDEMAQLEREVTEIDALVADLLASSRIDFTALTRTDLDAIEIAKNALERTGVDASRLEVSGGPIVFSGDATLVARAVSNLLENAKRHAGGVETLRVESRGGMVAFVVEDGGPGFAPGDDQRVFEPFYKRVSSASNGEESVGLGLALVKKIAEAHQGRVFAENRAKGGARVGVEFAR